MLTEAEYFSIRSKLISNELAHIVAVERQYMDFLVDVTLRAADSINTDFCQVTELMPFWVNYPPRQRGRAPSGASIPWSEVGEKAISQNLVRALTLEDTSITFPGLPLGGDIRFATNDALIHFDVKLTGPNDRADEIVASPHQISGDGVIWENNGVVNSPANVTGARASMIFQPELPPFYVLNKRPLVCLTYFLKAVYEVKSIGDQPLKYLEVACVPNGLLMFDEPQLARTPGLLIPGKDEQTYLKKRTRVRLEPLANLHDWRCIQIVKVDDKWITQARNQGEQLKLI
ncbi:MAG: BglI family type II restriction endonuclease [Pyrinomonadaceae bacterium]|nr:BglI family type II restriction endonuclease [Pyrinomonadaceae bacterium]